MVNNEAIITLRDDKDYHHIHAVNVTAGLLKSKVQFLNFALYSI